MKSEPLSVNVDTRIRVYLEPATLNKIIETLTRLLDHPDDNIKLEAAKGLLQINDSELGYPSVDQPMSQPERIHIERLDQCTFPTCTATHETLYVGLDGVMNFWESHWMTTHPETHMPKDYHKLYHLVEIPWYSAPPRSTPSERDLPHSRACGIKIHDHGVDCHTSCPTCQGQPFWQSNGA